MSVVEIGRPVAGARVVALGHPPDRLEHLAAAGLVAGLVGPLLAAGERIAGDDQHPHPGVDQVVPQQLGRQVPAGVGAGAALDLTGGDVHRPGAPQVQRPPHRQGVRAQLGAQPLGALLARGVEIVDEPAGRRGQALQLPEGGGMVAGALVEARGQSRRLEQGAVVAVLAGEGAGLFERHPRRVQPFGLEALGGDGQERGDPQPVLLEGALEGQQAPCGEAGEIRRAGRHQRLQQGGDQPDPQRGVVHVGEPAERLEGVVRGDDGPLLPEQAGEEGVGPGLQAPRVRGDLAALRRLLRGQLEHVEGEAHGPVDVADGLEGLREAEPQLALGVLEQRLAHLGKGGERGTEPGHGAARVDGAAPSPVGPGQGAGLEGAHDGEHRGGGAEGLAAASAPGPGARPVGRLGEGAALEQDLHHGRGLLGAAAAMQEGDEVRGVALGLRGVPAPQRAAQRRPQQRGAVRGAGGAASELRGEAARLPEATGRDEIAHPGGRLRHVPGAGERELGGVQRDAQRLGSGQVPPGAVVARHRQRGGT